MKLRLMAFLAASAIVFGACGGTASPTSAPATAAPATAPAATAAAPTAAAPTAAPATASAAATSAAATASAATGGTVPGTTVSITRFTAFGPLFHPMFAEASQYTLYYVVFQTLIERDLSDKTLQTYIPAMATEWTASPDATTFTFKLRNDVKWHDGQPFTAKDVAYTANWGAENRTNFDTGFAPSWYFLKGAADAQKACDAAPTDPKVCGGGIDHLIPGIKIVDDYTIEFTTEQPYGLFFSKAADAVSAIMPRHLLEGQLADQIKKGDFMNKTPIGTGPYKLARIVPGQFVEFDAFADFYKGPPHIEKVFYKDIPPDQGLAQLETGDLDLALSAGAGNIARLQGMAKINTVVVPTPGYLAVVMFDETPEARKATKARAGGETPGFPFYVKEVRQAVYYAIDRRGIDQALYGGANPIVWNPPGYLSDVPGLNEYPFDPQKAKDLLAGVKAKGIDISQPIRYVCPVDTADSGRICPIIKQQLEAVGLKVTITNMDNDTFNTYSSDLTQRDKYDMEMIQGGGGLDPSSSAFHITCHQDMFDTGYENCALVDLYNKATTLADPAERNKIWDEVAKIVNEEQPMPYLWAINGVFAVSKRLQNVMPPAFDRYITMNIEDWTVSQ